MKHAFFICLLVGTLFSCAKTDVPEIIAKWHLIETLADPGNGSGTFTPVTSFKTVEFFIDGTFSSNGDMCFMSTDITTPSTGNYSTVTKTITPTNCTATTVPISYEIVNGELIVTYPCIEACKAKFELVP